MDKKFPKDFYWGAATASYQVEGGIEDVDWAEAARRGYVPHARKACDHYNRYEEDFDIAKSLGHNAHRLSIEWSRIEPEAGKFDEGGIEHYRKVLRALRARGIEPFVTLWHFTSPTWFSETGGFERGDAPEVFARYAAYVAKELGGECRHFSTINEPIVYANNGWLRGTWPPFKRFSFIDFVRMTNSGKMHNRFSQKGIVPFLTYLRVRKNLAAAHRKAYVAMKKIRPESDISIVRDVFVFDANWNPINKLIASIMNWFWTYRFQNGLKGQYDSIGLNYYFHKTFGDRRKYKKSDIGWHIRPEGIYNALYMLSRYKKPIFISETGIADREDVYRGDYIRGQIRAVHLAIEEGIDVRGFMYWSLLDNFEWALGYEQKFGLVEVDFQTFKRTIRPSAYVYKEICEKNALV